MSFEKMLMANLSVRCYLHVFHRLLKVLDVIKKIESIMCYVDVIEVMCYLHFFADS